MSITPSVWVVTVREWREPKTEEIIIMETVSEIVDIKTPDGTMAARVYKPADGGQYPAIIVIQEIFGIDNHIQDVAQRFAAQGYVAAAPDLFYRTGRLQTIEYDQMQSSGALREGMSDDGTVGDLNALVAYLNSAPSVSRQEVGITGYCMGGRVSFLAACRVDNIGAAAVYYGGGIVPRPGQTATGPAPIDLASQISCPIIGFFGGQDQGISSEAVDKIRDTLKELGKDAEILVYPEAGHGFFCDARGSYNKDASEDAWNKTLTFFEKHLKGATVAAG
jgi:carboxymethylenebutenolidase